MTGGKPALSLDGMGSRIKDGAGRYRRPRERANGLLISLLICNIRAAMNGDESGE